MKNGNSYLGIDFGSKTKKLVAIGDDGILDTYYGENVPGMENLETIREFYRMLSEKGYDVKGSFATGSQMNNRSIYVEVAKINGAPPKKVSELMAHTKGTEYLLGPLDAGIIDIGGHDSKIIITNIIDGKNGKDNGKVTGIVDYAMNESCAATTGSCIDEISERFGIPIEAFGELALKGYPHADDSISATCAVFLKNSLTQRQHLSSDALAASACKKMAEMLYRTFGPMLDRYSRETILFQGGVASNKGMVHALEDVLEAEITVPHHDEVEEINRLMGALGAAHLARIYSEFKD